MGGLAALILAIIIISAVVGVIAQFLNKLNEANAPPVRRQPPPRGGARPGQADRDMDRFLAEIDRLRKKNTQNAEGQSSREDQPAKPPVAQPARAEKPLRARVVAETVEPTPVRVQPRGKVDEQGFVIQPSAPSLPIVARAKADELPVATVVESAAGSANLAAMSPMAQVTRLTALPGGRSRPVAKTDLAKSLTGLLNSGQGIAIAVILQEILGPPKSRQ